MHRARIKQLGADEMAGIVYLIGKIGMQLREQLAAYFAELAV